ncbi:MAG: peptidylprolyl isomerase [Sphingosinicella sp.]|uniref:peptidylprolyl isomerase n=1 Tax=Sphingosinicella sp. TaxID=1917971 RepID=UPI004037A836
MIRPLARLVLLTLLAAGCGEGAPPIQQEAEREGTPLRVQAAERPPPPPATQERGLVRVRLETEAGGIVLLLDGRRAPVTVTNFLRYVDAGRFDDTNFYRAARTRGHEGRGFIQGGIHRNYRLMFHPIAHEPTNETGLSHVEGAISMARSAPGNAMGEFFITTAAITQMDAQDGRPGYAAFGRVIEGMDVVRTILASETVPNAGRGAMRNQMIDRPVRIISARRIE